MWSFDPSLPADLDFVRQLIGDTEATEPLVPNEFIEKLLTTTGNVYKAASIACWALSIKFGKKQSKTIGPLSLSYGEQSSSFATMAEQYARLATSSLSGAGTNVFVGGIYETDRMIREADPETGTPYFRPGMHDNPEHGNDFGTLV